MMTKSRFRLLFAGIISLLLLSSFSIWKIFQSERRINEQLHEYEEHGAGKEAVRELTLLINRSQHLTMSWIFIQSYDSSKLELNQLQEVKYPVLRHRIINLAARWHATERTEMESIVSKTDSLIMLQREIVMAELRTFENYENPVVRKGAEDALQKRILPASQHVLGRLYIMEDGFQHTTEEAWTNVIAKINETKMRSLLLSSLMFAAGVIGLIIMLGVRSGQS